MTDPRRPGKRTGLVVGAALTVAALLGGGGLLLQADSVATGNPSPARTEPSGDPEAIAQEFGAIVEDQLHRGTTDLSAFEDVYCAHDLEKARQEDFKIATKPRTRARITVEDVRTKGGAGTFTLTYANPSRKPADDVVQGDLVVEGGRWRVCNVFTPATGGSNP